MYDAMDGRRTIAHGALLVTIGTLLCLAGWLPASAHASGPAKPYIVIYKKASAPAVRAATREIAAEEDIDPTQRFGTAVRGFAAKLDVNDRVDIRKDPRVLQVVPDLPVKATSLVPMLAGDNIPAGVRRVGAAVDSTVREAGSVNVAVIDTGISLTHPDLNAVAGTDCTGSGTADDGNGHGTHVAGTIGARNNGSGAEGIAPGTKLWAVRVLGANGSGLTSQVICGIDWVTATRTDANPDNDIAVANMSLGAATPYNDNCGRTVGDAMHMAICASVAAGVTYVVAAGNSGADEQNFAPASYPEVITVTAMADSDGLPGGLGGPLSCYAAADDTPAGFSNYATRPTEIAHTIAAPGTCIRSTYPGGYATLSGTSMASPHVTGLVALCEGDGGAHGPCWGKTPAQVRDIVMQAAADRSAADPAGGFAGDPTRPSGSRYYGYLASAAFGGTTTPPPPPPSGTLPSNTLKPVVSGVAMVGGTLQSTTGSWTGTAPITFSRQWMRCTTTATTACLPIAGATGATYQPTADDAARYLRVTVTATNGRGSVDALSGQTAAITVPTFLPANTVKPAVTGTAVVGATLTSTTGAWTGTAPITFVRQWMRCTTTAATSCAAISGAAAVNYVLTTADTGRFIRLRVTARNVKGSVIAFAEPTAIVTNVGGKPVLTASPVISGTVTGGATLTASTGSWTGASPMDFTVSWAVCAPGSNVCYYNGLTGATLTIPAGTAAGTRYVVVVTARNAIGSSYGQSPATVPLT